MTLDRTKSPITEVFASIAKPYRDFVSATSKDFPGEEKVSALLSAKPIASKDINELAREKVLERLETILDENELSFEHLKALRNFVKEAGTDEEFENSLAQILVRKIITNKNYWGNMDRQSREQMIAEITENEDIAELVKALKEDREDYGPLRRKYLYPLEKNLRIGLIDKKDRDWMGKVFANRMTLTLGIVSHFIKDLLTVKENLVAGTEIEKVFISDKELKAYANAFNNFKYFLFGRKISLKSTFNQTSDKPRKAK